MSDERLKALLDAALARRDLALDDLDRAHQAFIRARADVKRLANTLSDPALNAPDSEPSDFA